LAGKPVKPAAIEIAGSTRVCFTAAGQFRRAAVSLTNIALAAAALMLAANLMPVGPSMRGVLFVILLGAGVIALIGLGLNHLGG
jgi:hypothetical protein